MANPQKENGHTQIANEILEHLSKPGISGSEYRILLCVIRKTYGFQKKKDYISISQFQKFTVISRSHVVRILKSLVHKRVLLKEKSVYTFNKNWETWLVHKRAPSARLGTTASARLGSKGSAQSWSHKRNKETITKERMSDPFEIRGEEFETAMTSPGPLRAAGVNNEYTKEFLLFWEAYPRKEGKRAANFVWETIKAPPELFKRIMEAVRHNQKTEQWQEENGKYVPMPSTWLRESRWEDEIKTNHVRVIDLSK